MDTNIKNLPEGDYMTELGYSQCYPWKVMRRTAQTAVLQRVKTAPDPDWKPEMHSGGFCAHCSNQGRQTWLYDGLENHQIRVRLNKHGQFVRRGVRFIAGSCRYFYDYNF